jgi:hypothetical protein
VSQISSLIIGGGNYTELPGFFQYTSNIAAVLSQQTSSTPGPGSFNLPYDYAQAGSAADGVLSIFNSGGTGQREVGYPQLLLFDNPSLSPATRYFSIDTFVGPLIIRGVASRASGPWDNRSGQIANGIGNGWYIGVELYYPPSTTNGDPSSAFGFTVQGGTQFNPSPSQFFGSVSVTPGQTYSINVGGPQGGFVQFQFVQG